MAVGEPGVDDDGERDRGKDEIYFFLGPPSDAEEAGNTFKVRCANWVLFHAPSSPSYVLLRSKSMKTLTLR